MMLRVSCQLSVVSRRFIQRTTDYGPRTDSARRGLSLTEVLISMGILTVGLLSVASIFPVGSFYMQKAEISDKASAIAQSVMNEIVARGMLNPRSWYVMVPSPADAKTSTSPNAYFNGIDGKYAPLAT